MGLIRCKRISYHRILRKSSTPFRPREYRL